MNVDRILFDVGIAGAGGALSAIGVYTEDCSTKLLDTGAVDTSTGGIKNIDVTDAVIGPGYFVLAYTTNDITVEVASSLTDATGELLWNTGTVQIGTSSLTSTAAVLPATCGTISADIVNRVHVKFLQ